MNVFTLSFLMMLGLKLLGLVSISWWWVFSPIIVGAVIAILLGVA